MTLSALRIVSLYPDMLGTYGGNALVLGWRVKARGLPVEIVEVKRGSTPPSEGDLYLLGGGEDEAQAAATESLRGSVLANVMQRDTPIFAVCAGLQLLGVSFASASGREVSGLGLLDLRTTRLMHRAVGETVVVPDPELDLPHVTGFSNHGGSTVLGPKARPFGLVTSGPGNAGASDQVEGVIQGSAIGTYLHGPVLARNPALADHLLSLAFGSALPSLPAGGPEQLHAERLAAARNRGPWLRGRQRRSRSWRP
jgi:CobQ-like glutamine amidotransferase family enzyme